MTSVRKFYISKSVKNRKPAEMLRNILTFDKESKRKLLSLMLADSFIKNEMTLGFKHFYDLNGKLFYFEKTSFRYYEFSVAIIVFCETVVKVACITRMDTDRNYSTQTIIQC